MAAVRFNPTGLWDHDVVTPGKVGAYCYTIGSTIFVTERFKDQGAKFDMEEIVRDMLAKLITKLEEAEMNKIEKQRKVFAQRESCSNTAGMMDVSKNFAETKV